MLNLREILVPLAFALLIAMLLNPLVTRFQRWKLNKVFAIIAAMLTAFIGFCALGYFLSSQIMRFSKDLPIIEKKLTILFQQFQVWAVIHLKIPMDKQNTMLENAKENLQPILEKAAGTMLGTITVSLLLPVYTFLFLYYKTLTLNFLYEVFAEENLKEVNTVVHQSKSAIQNYMVGLLIEGCIVAALNSIALFMFGVKYSILLGVIGAILNVLPYIGGIIAVLLPVLVATITKDGFNTQIAVVIAYIIIQFIDNHFLIPWVVSSRVRINALISIVIVLLGGALWGLAGMFLAIPFTGVLKIIFDRMPELKPWGKLLGDEIPYQHKGEIWKRRAKRIIQRENTKQKLA